MPRYPDPKCAMLNCVGFAMVAGQALVTVVPYEELDEKYNRKTVDHPHELDEPSLGQRVL